MDIAEKTGIADLRLTTHEVEDFETLMASRIRVLAEHHLTLSDIVRIAQDVMPFAGSIEFLSWLRKKGPVLILSDTFVELADDVVVRLGGYPLFSNRFETDASGRIVGYQLRIRGQKDRIVTALRDIGYTLFAIGDGFNDLSMLKTAHHPFLYNPSADLVRKLPGKTTVRDYVELKREIEKILATIQVRPGLHHGEH